MDLGGEAVLILQGCGGLRPWENTKAGVMLVTEDPPLIRVRMNPTTESSRWAAPNDLERRSKFKKDVKIEGTNSATHLESTKVSKKQTQTRPKQSGEMCCKYAKEPKQSKLQTSFRWIPNRRYAFARLLSSGPD
jgi:hypothetical protein